MKIILSLSQKFKIKIRKMTNKNLIMKITNGNMNKEFIEQILIQQLKYVTQTEILWNRLSKNLFLKLSKQVKRV